MVGAEITTPIIVGRLVTEGHVIAADVETGMVIQAQVVATGPQGPRGEPGRSGVSGLRVDTVYSSDGTVTDVLVVEGPNGDLAEVEFGESISYTEAKNIWNNA